MAPSLYATKISDLAKPVSEPKEKKPRSEKQIAAFEKAREARKKTLEAKKSYEKPVEKVEQMEPASPPQTVSEPEIETQVLEDVKVEEEEIPKETKPKKERKTKKRPASEEISETITEKAIKIETKEETTQSEEEAPAWFKSYVIGVKEEQAKAANDKRPKKQVRIEASAVAQKQWQQPQTRERVQNTVNNHMQKMYSMVFPNRRL